MMVDLAASFFEHMVNFFQFAFSTMNTLQNMKLANGTWHQESRCLTHCRMKCRCTDAQIGVTGPGQMFQGFCIYFVTV